MRTAALLADPAHTEIIAGDRIIVIDSDNFALHEAGQRMRPEDPSPRHARNNPLDVRRRAEKARLVEVNRGKEFVNE